MDTNNSVDLLALSSSASLKAENDAKNKLPSTSELTNALGIPSKAKSRRTWSAEEDEKLRLLVSYWGDQCGRNGHWDKISSHFVNRTNKDCRKRWFHSLDPKLKRGRWTPHEDEVLLEAYKKLGPSWHKISQLIPGRTDDQCSKRYNDVLDPNISERLRPWTPEEDKRLLELVQKFSTKWRLISKEMEGRTGLTCRNRWRKLVSPVVKERGTDHGLEVGADSDAGEVRHSELGHNREIGQLPMQLTDQLSNELSNQVSNQLPSQHSGQQLFCQLSSQLRTHTSSLNSNSTSNLNANRTKKNAHSPLTLQLDTSSAGWDAGRPHPVRESTQYGSGRTDLSPLALKEGLLGSTRYTVSLERDSQDTGEYRGQPRQSANESQRNQRDMNNQNHSTETALSFQQLEDLVQLAFKMGQKIVVHQHNYYINYPSSGASEVPDTYHKLHQHTSSEHQPSPSQELSSSSRATPLVPPTPGFLELELMDMAEDAFQDYGDPDLSFDLGNFHGIPFNPS